MAEAWFNELAQGWGQARSCGTMPAARMDSLTTLVMAEAGLDLRAHAPQAASQALGAQADWVVFMGPDVYPRVWTPDRIWEFRDPSGLSIVHYRVLRDTIRVQVQQFVDELRREHFEPNEAESAILALMQQELIMQSLFM